MGVLTVTIQNLEIVDVDLENNVILVKGNVPGAKNALVVIKSAVKNPNKVNPREELVTYVSNEVIENTKDVTDVVENTTEEKVESAE